MSERFFSPRPITSDRHLLDGPEAHHLLHVMRAAVGDSVTLFDDSGAEFQAVVEILRRTDAELRVIKRHEINRELSFALTLGVALPKGDRQKWLAEKLTELGVTTLVPLVTERSIAQPNESTLDRLHRAVIEAAKQCGRNRLMRIAPPQTWNDWINRERGNVNKSENRNPKSENAPERRLLALSAGDPLNKIDLAQLAAIRVAIGPEGGLTDEEVSAAVAAGWQSVSLGPRVLRIETAAIALAAAVALQ